MQPSIPFILPNACVPADSILADLPLWFSNSFDQKDVCYPFFAFCKQEFVTSVCNDSEVIQSVRIQIEIKDIKNSENFPRILELLNLGFKFDLWVYAWPTNDILSQLQPLLLRNSLRVIKLLRPPLDLSVFFEFPDRNADICFLWPLVHHLDHNFFSPSELALSSRDARFKVDKILSYDGDVQTGQLTQIIRDAEKIIKDASFLGYLEYRIKQKSYSLIKSHPERRWVFTKYRYMALLPLLKFYWSLKDRLRSFIEAYSPDDQR